MGASNGQIKLEEEKMKLLHEEIEEITEVEEPDVVADDGETLSYSGYSEQYVTQLVREDMDYWENYKPTKAAINATLRIT